MTRPRARLRRVYAAAAHHAAAAAAPSALAAAAADAGAGAGREGEEGAGAGEGQLYSLYVASKGTLMMSPAGPPPVHAVGVAPPTVSTRDT